ncbi:MAG: MaoC family dehydratase N-terminal domain-containing protein [Elusimicrobiota bacterium]
MKTEVKAGQVIEYRRTITEEDVARFAELSGDKGRHHLQRDEQGRLMAHGLLTATLPTKLGGDLDYMARTMHFDFQKAVYGGDALLCKGLVESVIVQSTRLKVRFAFEISNQHGEVVLKGSSAGMILR